MKRKHTKTLEQIFRHPVSGNIRWEDVESLLVHLGSEVEERRGSRVAVLLFDEGLIFHRPHPSPNADKGAIAGIRRWMDQHGVRP